MSLHFFLMFVHLGFAGDVAKCVRNIYDDNQANSSRQTLYVHARKDLDFLQLGFPILNLGLEGRVHRYWVYRKYDSYLLVVDEVSLVKAYRFISKLDTWNPRAMTVLVYSGGLELVFGLLGQYRVYNVVVVDVGLRLYTYAPFKYENFNRLELGAVELGRCGKARVSFGGQLGRYWRNSTALVSYMPLPPYVICAPCGTGIEVQLCKLLSTKLLFNLSFDPVAYDNWGVKVNGSYVGAIQPVHKGRADFCIGHFHLREPDHLIDFEYTFSYMEDDLRWGLPSAELMSHWANLVHIFSLKSWLCIITTLAMSSVSWRLLGGRSKKGYYASWYVLELPFLTLLGLAPKAKPATPLTKLLYITMWVMCFTTCTIWNSHLISALTHDSYEAQITSMQELIDSDLKLGIHPELALMYKSTGTQIGRHIYANFHSCDAGYTCLDRVGRDRDMASITTKRIFRSSLPERYKTKDGKNTVELLDAYVIKDLTVMYFQKGHPLFERMNDALIRLRGGGFIARLDLMNEYTNSLTYRNALFSKSRFGIKVLTVDQMKGPFWLLVLGNVASSIVFVIEVYYSWRQGNGRMFYVQ